MKHKKLLLIFILAAALTIVFALQIKKKVFPVFVSRTPTFSETIPNDSNTYRMEKKIDFADGSYFNVSRFVFGKDDALKGKYTFELQLEGNDISIKWQDYNTQPFSWRQTNELSGIPPATLFLETDKSNMILSVPALYTDNFEHKTLTAINELPVRIEGSESGYLIYLDFEAAINTIGEFWYYKTNNELIDWNEENNKLWLRQDLHKNRRFSFDGYYFKTYENYIPYGENIFFRNAANFTGAQILALDGINSSSDIGYAMTKICMDNQNAYGFWETGPMSTWLYNDYGISFDFYDTRFSTDFAISLLTGYEKYNDESFLNSAEIYAKWLMQFIDNEGYEIGNDSNILVPDYWGESQEKKTHVSLNHQLNEMNFLIEIYLTTNNEMYLDYAFKLLGGISATLNDWIMADNNLNYALMYDETSNVMIDYPYLTYNDLFESKELLSVLGVSSHSIEKLMESKKIWMDHNNITEYRVNLQ